MKRFFNSFRHERPAIALFFLLGRTVDQIRGRALASLLGWPRCYLGPGAKIRGSKAIQVGAGAYINRFSWIEAVHFFRGQSFTPSICIGRGFAVSDGLHISAVNCITIGDNCLFGSNVYISDHNHGAYKEDQQSSATTAPVDRALASPGPVTIGANVWLGDNVVIVGAVSIGNGVVVGANSVVTRDLPDHVMAAGSPIQIIKQFDPQTGQWHKPA